MTDEEQRKLAVKTALDFIANEAAFIPIPENSAVMIEYFENHPELEPTDIASYRQAFHASRDRLRFEHQMSAEEYRQKVVIPVFQKRQQAKPQPSETDALLKDLLSLTVFEIR